MKINDSKELDVAIENLKKQSEVRKQSAIRDMHSMSQIVDPAYQIHKILPLSQSFGKTFNYAIDEALLETALSFNKKIIGGSSNSISKTIGNKMLDNATTMVVKNNSLKIKAYSLAVLKNIFS